MHRLEKAKIRNPLWREALTTPRRGLLNRLQAEAQFVSYRTVLETLDEGKTFAERDCERRKP